jgi:hypothetical protein
MVEEHLKECENCRKLAEDITDESEKSEIKVPDESKVFRKVNRKMKRSKLKTVLLSIVLLVMLGGLGVLTFGQITHKEGFISFETLVQSLETRKIAKLIAEGDMDAYADSVTYGTNMDANLNILQNLDEIKEQYKKSLNEAYDKYMKGMEVKHIYSFAQYENEFYSYSEIAQPCCTIINSAVIEYKNGISITLDFVKSYDGKYLCLNAYNSEEYSDNAKKNTAKFCDVINYVNIPKLFPDGIAEILFTKYNKDSFKNKPDNWRFLMRNWFIEKEQENVNSGMLSYYRENGFTIDKFISSEIRYDKDKAMMYYDFFFEGRDEKGTAMMTAKIYSTPEGLIPPAKEDIKIVPNGCTDELVEALGGFFGKK